MDGVALGCESHLCHNFSPCTCWHKFGRPPGLQKRAAHTHQTPCVHRVGTHPLLPSSDPGQRYGSWHQGHLGKSETSDTAYSCNTGNNERVGVPWRHQVSLTHVEEKKSGCFHACARALYTLPIFPRGNHRGLEDTLSQCPHHRCSDTLLMRLGDLEHAQDGKAGGYIGLRACK